MRLPRGREPQPGQLGLRGVGGLREQRDRLLQRLGIAPVAEVQEERPVAGGGRGGAEREPGRNGLPGAVDVVHVLANLEDNPFAARVE